MTKQEPVFDDETRKEAVQILQSIVKRDSLVKREIVDSKFEKHVAMLVSLGLVRSVATLEGVAYEITEIGSRFLKEYGEIKSEKPILEIEPERVLGPLVRGMVTVVIPTLNEADGISKVIEEVKAEGYGNIMVIDGYSTDNTPHIANGRGAKVVYQHGCGKAGAVRTAIEYVDTPYILFMDGDHTYDPKDIWRLLNHRERYAHVIGARDRKHIPRLHRFGNWLISELFSALFIVKTSDVCSGMYLLEIEEASKYSLQEAGFVAEIELAAESASRESLTEVPISYRPRIGTRKLNTWRDGLAILSAAFGLARRHNPVLLYSAVAGLSIIPAVAVLGWVVMQQLTTRTFHSAWALAGIMLVLVAVQAFTLASVSILIRHAERRFIRESKSNRS